MPKQDDSNWPKFAAVGLEIAAGVALGAFVGYWLDTKFHSNPWGVLIGSALGFASGLYLFIKEALKANKP
ncbi:MAG: AtpZ/AtpI family protein [Tepidisphaeraceae bacterium]|jgi:F0F1-type ATP synthase assembly protein I